MNKTSKPVCIRKASSPALPDLIRQRELSSGDRGTGNLIVQGDNLAALRRLESSYSERVRCVYIDPPYNNQEKYRHYDDRLGHDAWLGQTISRIELLAQFLRPDGSLWISIDDRELHYLKVAVDEAMGRKNFVTTVVWQHRKSRENRKVFSANHEYILVYARDLEQFKRRRNGLAGSAAVQARYRNPDDDPRGPWQSVSANVQAGHATPGQFYDVVAPNGRKHHPPPGRCWVYTRWRMEKEIALNNLWFGKNGDGVPRIKRFLDAGTQNLTPETLWSADDVGTTEAAKKHLLQLFPRHRVFDTPKPESLIRRIIEIASDPDDIVLDAYLGSGTTAATAHKLRRRYIGIEKGAHAVTLVADRMKKVIHGETGGISRDVGWQGGGGFDFYQLRAGVRRTSPTRSVRRTA
ncbi:MAG: site-specific DNA-methyltransferase [Chloroflexota bacterium]|nr:site-specific DNA-methyltransferase [Chloroflexota bacterium]